MQPAEIYRLLTQRVRRGLIIFTGLWFASVISCGLLMVYPAGRPWAAAIFLVGMFAGLGRAHVYKRNVAARKVAFDPRLVYWAHPILGLRKDPHDPRPIGAFSSEAILDCTVLTLHLRDGTHCEVSLPNPEMHVFVAWLSEKNPTVRMGTYDALDSVLTEDDV